MNDDEIKALVSGVQAEIARVEGLVPKSEKKDGESEKPETKKCPSCGGDIIEGVKYCPYCGVELEWN